MQLKMLAMPNWIWSYSRVSALMITAHVVVIAALARDRTTPIKTEPRQHVRVATIHLQPKVQEAPTRVVAAPRKKKAKPAKKRKAAKKKPAKAPAPVVAVDPAPYREELAERLALMLRLPEFGAVRVSLTLGKLGEVRNIEILNEANAKNRAYVIEELQNSTFPPLGRFFPKEEEHTFCLTLNNDL